MTASTTATKEVGRVRSAGQRAVSSNGQHHTTAAGPIDKFAPPISSPRRVGDKESYCV